MPAKFDACVKAGGRVRTRSLPNNKFMRICFLGNKSFPGEVRTKQSEGGDNMKKNKKIQESFKENLSFNILEKTIDEEKRTVRVCALAPCISKNGRYYSPKIVESVSGTLKNKKSFADHDFRDTEHLIGRIVKESYENGKLYADIKIGKRGMAGDIWAKIQDGIVDAVSIAANGKAKTVEMDGKEVAEVTELKIHSVDFVPEGGITDAKVVQVFEKLEDIPKTKEVKKKMIENVKQLREEYPDLVAEIEEAKVKETKEATDKVTKLEKELTDIKMAGIIESEIEKLETTKEVKAILKEKVTGKTEEEVKASVKTHFDFMKSVVNAAEGEATIEGVVDSENTNKKEKNKDATWTAESIRDHTSIPSELKKDAINVLHYKGSKVLVEYLERHEVKL